LLEWSIVPIPANQESLLLAVKAAKIDEYKDEVIEKIWDDAENEIRYRIKEPNLFEQDSFRTIPIKKDDPKINGIAGKLKGETTMTLQSLRFPKPDWDMAKAQDWVKAHPDIKKDFDLNNENWLNDPVAYEEDDILIMLEMINSDDSLLTHFNSKYPDVMKALKDKLTYEDKIESKYQKLASSIEELVELIKKSI
jgi:hypothetical protein